MARTAPLLTTRIAAWTFAAAASTSAAFAVTVEGVTLPDSIDVQGRQLPLSGCGTREAFFTDIYVAGLYLPEQRMSQQQILSPDTPKAVRLDIVYDGTLPQDIPDSWREPLNRMVSYEIKERIASIYAGFGAGDRITLKYDPQAGTQIIVNGERVRSMEGDAVIRPLLRLWIGDEAVSANLRQLLLSGQCARDDGWF